MFGYNRCSELTKAIEAFNYVITYIHVDLYIHIYMHICDNLVFPHTVMISKL